MIPSDALRGSLGADAFDNFFEKLKLEKLRQTI